LPIRRRLWADHGLLFPYRIGEELPTKRPLCETWARMSHPDPNGPPDRRPIRVGEVWENPVYGELLLRRATWHETLLHPFLYVIDFKRALSFGEAQLSSFSFIFLIREVSVIGWRIIGLSSDELVSNSPGLYPSHDETFW
jgi:hypothetical protein